MQGIQERLVVEQFEVDDVTTPHGGCTFWDIRLWSLA
jgi:hypothetical protein